MGACTEGLCILEHLRHSGILCKFTDNAHVGPYGQPGGSIVCMEGVERRFLVFNTRHDLVGPCIVYKARRSMRVGANQLIVAQIGDCSIIEQRPVGL